VLFIQVPLCPSQNARSAGGWEPMNKIDQTTDITSIENDVKMVIWDLDDTLWTGILSEDEVKIIGEHVELVKRLAARGIISSIVSKNDFETAKRVLERAGLWNYFVFPSISYAPKGKRVCQIIENASLRTKNVLFVDDNVLNLQEVRFFNNGIMLAQPKYLPSVVARHPRFAGKPDPELKRLKQYQLLQRKFLDQQTTSLSNEDFLRVSGIKISFGFDVEANFDRVVDLLNRANQLNYTKIRLSTQTDIDALKATLNEYGISAACISCCDRYGDYGIIGFYMLKRRTAKLRLVHFVFSCRTMNMGIEHFIYQYLGKPEITIIPEVAYALESDKPVDWISVSEPNTSAGDVSGDKKLLLVGGCELLQLATYCSTNRVEFVNTITMIDGDEYKVRYDDPYFFITDRTVLHRSELMSRLAAWTYDDTLLLDRSISDAKVIVLAMRASFRHPFIVTKDGINVRMERSNIKRYLEKHAGWFRENFTIVDIPVRERLTLIRRSFDRVGQRSTPDAVIFLMGAATHKPQEPIEEAHSGAYNNCCSQYCQSNPKFRFVDVDSLVRQDQVIGDQHLTPSGYRALSIYVMNKLKNIDKETTLGSM
jgi:FkbH-like protein